MTDLATRWLGLELRSPLVVGASPLTDDLDALKACVKAGAGAVVMHSLFEEQLVEEQMAIPGSIRTPKPARFSRSRSFSKWDRAATSNGWSCCADHWMCQ